jgi:hypothetical protein
MNGYFVAEIAKARHDDLLREAAASRRVRAAHAAAPARSDRPVWTGRPSWSPLSLLHGRRGRFAH